MLKLRNIYTRNVTIRKNVTNLDWNLKRSIKEDVRCVWQHCWPRLYRLWSDETFPNTLNHLRVVMKTCHGTTNKLRLSCVLYQFVYWHSVLNAEFPSSRDWQCFYLSVFILKQFEVVLYIISPVEKHPSDSDDSSLSIVQKRIRMFQKQKHS